MVTCSACGEKIRIGDIGNLKEHKHLKVLICKKCYDFYDDGNFSEDETGDKYCRWCADGGRLIGCDFCSHAFCTNCIRRNMGRKELCAINTQESWSCYLCDPQPLKPHVKLCRKVIKYVRRKRTESTICSPDLVLKEVEPNCSLPQLEGKAENPDLILEVIESNSNPSQVERNSEPWALLLVNQAETAVEVLHRRISKVKTKVTRNVGNNNALHCVSQLKRVLSKHQSYVEYLLIDIRNKMEENGYDMDSSFISSTPVKASTSEIQNGFSFLGAQGGTNVIETENDMEGSDVEVITRDDGGKNGIVFLDLDANGFAGVDEDKPSVHAIQNQPPQTDLNGNCSAQAPDVKHEDFYSIPQVKALLSEVKGSPSQQSTSNEPTPQHSPVALDSESESDDVCIVKFDVQAAKEMPFSDESCKARKDSGDIHTGDSTVPSETENEDKRELILNHSSHDSDSIEKSDIKRVPNGLVSQKSRVTEPPSVKEEIDSDAENELARLNLLNSLMNDVANSKKKRRRVLVSSSSDSNDESKEIVEPELPDIETDPKLNAKAVVELEEMDFSGFFQRHKTGKRQRTVNPIPEPNISNLVTIPSNVKTNSRPSLYLSSGSEFEDTIRVSRRAAQRKTAQKLISSDSSDSAATPQEPFINKLRNITTLNQLARNDLLTSPESSLDSFEETTPKKKKVYKKRVMISTDKSSSSTDEDSDSSSNQVKEANKYQKFEKLLRITLTPLSKNELQMSEVKEKTKRGKTNRKRIKSMKFVPESSTTGTSSSDSSSKESSEDVDAEMSDEEDDCMVISDASNPEEVESKTPPDTPHKGRKNIRRVMDDQELGQNTKLASIAEAERRERVKARQKLYNQVTEEGGDFGDVVTRKLVLEVDKETKETLVEVPTELICKLKPHQVNGVKFMWECVIESLSRLENESERGSGCVLAHCMGLGKTLQVIAFVSTLLTNQRISSKIKTVLIVCPLNTIRNWKQEFDMWIGNTGNSVKIYELADVKNNEDRASLLRTWQEYGGVVITSYKLFSSLSEGKKASEACRETFQKALLNPGPDLIVCDEGHVLKSESSTITKTIGEVRTLRRVVLTGTPLQNNLLEYLCVVQFVKPFLLGTRKEFKNRFVNPISNGQCADSNQQDVKLMKKRVHILHKLLEGCIQRRDYTYISKYLPPKFEYVISVRLSEIQISLYRLYLDTYSGKSKEAEKTVKSTSSKRVLADHPIFRLIWTHPYLLQMQRRKDSLQAMFQNRSEVPIANGISEPDTNTLKKAETDVICLGGRNDSVPGTSQENPKCDDPEIEELFSNTKNKNSGVCNGNVNNHWWNKHVPEEDRLTSIQIDLSGKILLLLEILKHCELIGDKLLLFTQSLLTLDLMEELLQNLDEQNSNESENPDHIGTWESGIDYFRMDGKTNSSLRKKYIDHFNDPMNERARLFMISTRAGSLGTNLVGANRVVLMDASWNPIHDVQAIFRAYRFGQKKPVYVYRLLAQGTMEEKIYDRQVTKQSMAFRVVDEQQIERHFNAQDLEQLYSFTPDIKANRPTPIFPKDRLLAELLVNEETKNWIVTYHEHDSLLENIEAEELTEDERKLAWTEYEAEREGKKVQQGPQKPETDMKSFVMKLVDNCPTSNIIEMVKQIQKQWPSASLPELKESILLLDKICHRRYLDCQNAMLNNRITPEVGKAEMTRMEKLIVGIHPFKLKHCKTLANGQGNPRQLRPLQPKPGPSQEPQAWQPSHQQTLTTPQPIPQQQEQQTMANGEECSIQQQQESSGQPQVWPPPHLQPQTTPLTYLPQQGLHRPEYYNFVMPNQGLQAGPSTFLNIPVVTTAMPNTSYIITNNSHV